MYKSQQADLGVVGSRAFDEHIFGIKRDLRRRHKRQGEVWVVCARGSELDNVEFAFE